MSNCEKERKQQKTLQQALNTSTAHTALRAATGALQGGQYSVKASRPRLLLCRGSTASCTQLWLAQFSPESRFKEPTKNIYSTAPKLLRQNMMEDNGQRFENKELPQWRKKGYHRLS
jgi:hypothetical protein